jgi:hypothetical protein
MVRSATKKGVMIKDFNVSEKGHGAYWLLGILRWVMVLIFISSGYRNSCPSPQTALHYTFPTARSFLGCLSSGSEARLICSAHYRVDDHTRFIDWNWYVCGYVVVFLLDARCGRSFILCIEVSYRVDG